MKQNISILGCGWLGFSLAEHLISQGFNVKGSTTTISKWQTLQIAGISPYLIDLDHLDGSISAFLETDVVIICITSKNVNGFKELIGCIEKSTVKKVIFVSSTSVYNTLNQLVTEEMPVKDSPLSHIEKMFSHNTVFQSTILRFGGLFGYDRKPGNFFKGNRIIDHPEGFVNFIHRDDCIQIVNRIIDQDIWRETFNACADTHPTRRDFYTQEALKVGRETPLFNEFSTNEYKIVSNAKLKAILNYCFIYSDLMKV